MEDKKSGTNTPTISLPKGGGTIKGIGETFQPNLFSGTGNFSIPIYTSPGRSDFGPKLSLQYSTGNGNGIFGLGWQFSIPNISRKTEKGLPRYTNKDVFVMSGAEDLIPVLDDKGDPLIFPGPGDYQIIRYRPRIEGLFVRIERWTNANDIFWRVTTKENITSIYGKTEKSRISDPSKPHHIFKWLLEETFDAKGNHILYEYAKDAPDLDLKKIYEQNRTYSQKYIRKIYYGNLPDQLYDDDTQIGHKRNGSDHKNILHIKKRRYAFEVIFDYGDWDTPENYKHPDAQPQENQEIFGSDFPIRDDPFSSFRAGFEIRTLRRCKRVLLIHHFKELGEPIIVKSTDFDYDYEPHTDLLMLTSATVTGYKKIDNLYKTNDMPPVTFNYSEFFPEEQHYQSLNVEDNDFPCSSLLNPNYTLIDLYGDGLPDILNTTDYDYYHWRNMGDGTFDRRHPQYGKSHPDLRPAGVTLANPGITVGDMGGDGLPDIILNTPEISGFYEASPDGNWKTFKKFDKVPSAILNDPNTRLLDLTGDGLSDILVTKDDFFLWMQCLGEEGYSEPNINLRKHNSEIFPDIYFNDPTGRVRLADMTGDGLNDILLIHNTCIEYWPNKGYGKFGNRVVMDNAPHLEKDFDPRRLSLVDLDGTGCADLVYIDFGRVYFWFNHSGNSWSDEHMINGTPPVSDINGIQFADIFGTGTACLVWSYDYGHHGNSNYKVLDFCGTQKPHLLIEMNNNMGATTKAQYASSTKFYIEDLKNGKPWATNLPFPVQVLEKTEVIDHISKTKLVTTYKYHHGYYDGREREFRGFGRVDQFDSEEFEDFIKNDLHVSDDLFENKNEAFHVPTVETKTWFHTGVYFDENNVSPSGEFYDHHDLMEAYSHEFYQGDEKAFKPKNNTVENGGNYHEAYRALRGSILRTEVYAHDDTEKEEHPYVVTDNRFNVKCLQDHVKEDGRTKYHGVYLNTQRETISYHYERNPDDPRIAHTINIVYDKYGNLEESAAISYPRRSPLKDDNDDPYPEQAKTKAIYTFNKFINEDNKPYYYIGLNCETKVFEVHGLEFQWQEGYTNPFSIEQFDVLKDKNKYEDYNTPPDQIIGLKKRIVDWKRIYFRKNDHPDQIDAIGSLNHRCKFGEIESLGLSYESYQAAFTNDFITDLFPFADDIFLQSECSYHKEAVNDPEPDRDNKLLEYHWIPSGKQAFQPDMFFLPVEIQNPFGKKSSLKYDCYAFLLIESEDPLKNIIKAENDYRVLQPFRIIDPNENYSEVKFDILGMVAGTAVWGKDSGGNDVGDSLQNFATDLDQVLKEQHINDPLNLDGAFDTNPHNILGKATTRLIYDLKRYMYKDQPAVVYTMAREEHSSNPNGNNCNIQHSFLYSDGFGRETQTKVQAEPGPIYDENEDIIIENANPRWVGTGTKVYNNKGKPVREYEPFFSDSHNFSIEQHGVSPTLFYDPLERVVCTLHPNHTYEKVVFDAWKQEIWDTNDTIDPLKKFDPANPEIDFNPIYDPHVEIFFKNLPDDKDFLPTWYKIRMDDAESLKKWPDRDDAGDPLPDNIRIRNENIRKAEKNSAQNAACHASTPTITHLDNLDRPFLTIQDNGKDKDGKDILIKTHVKLDIEGNEKEIIDPRKITAFTHIFDIAGRKLVVESVDAGLKKMLPDIAGNPVYTKDANENEVRIHYDELRRPTETRVKEKNIANYYLAEKTIYGDYKGQSAGDINESRVYHRRGQIWKVYDGAGLVVNNDYDFKGNLLSVSRRLLNDGTSRVKWPLNGEIFDEPQADDKLHPEENRYIIFNEYDALNRITTTEMPDGTIHEPKYNEANLLDSLKVGRNGDLKDYITNIDYNAKGQRTSIQYKNRVTTEYTYEPETYRLSTILTKRKGPNDPKILQDIRYTYDPVGNITNIRDDAHPLIFYNNHIAEPESTYKYDPIYRLIATVGREHESMSACHYQSKDKKNTEFLPYPQSLANAHAICKYIEKYTYDHSGNLELIDHLNITTGDHWKREQKYQVDNPDLPEEEQTPLNNRLYTSNGICDKEDDPIPHDNNGNITALPHLPEMKWNFKNQLVEVQLNTGVNPNKAYYQYDISEQRVRKTIVKDANREERIYLGGYEIYVESDGAGPRLRRDTVHVMDDKNLIALIEEEKAPDNPANILNTRIRYQLSNHLGSSILEVDGSPNAEIISYEEYYPYGGTAYLSGKDLNETSLKRYRYSGKERDDETSMYYYGARYYAPWMGRWISTDPIGYKDGLNLYMFVRGNPVGFKDMAGKQTDSKQKDDVQEQPETGYFYVAPSDREGFLNHLESVLDEHDRISREMSTPRLFFEDIVRNREGNRNMIRNLITRFKKAADKAKPDDYLVLAPFSGAWPIEVVPGVKLMSGDWVPKTKKDIQVLEEMHKISNWINLWHCINGILGGFAGVGSRVKQRRDIPKMTGEITFHDTPARIFPPLNATVLELNPSIVPKKVVTGSSEYNPLPRGHFYTLPMGTQLAISDYWYTLSLTRLPTLAGSAGHKSIGAAPHGPDLTTKTSFIELKFTLRGLQPNAINEIIMYAKTQNLNYSLQFQRETGLVKINQVRVFDMQNRLMISR